MKRFVSLAAFAFSLCVLSMTGCDSGGTQVIEAPPETEAVDPAMEGMSDEEYDKAMEESMNQQ